MLYSVELRIHISISINNIKSTVHGINKMVTRKTTARRHQPEPIPESSNKNLMGIVGLLMLVLTNYQEEIKHVISVLLGSTK